MMKFVKVSGFALLVFALSASEIAAQSNPEKPKFSLTIKAQRSEVAVGSDIQIEITITNTSDDPLIFASGRHGNLPDGYEYDVHDEQGTMAVKFGKRYVQLPDGNILQLPSRPAGSHSLGGQGIQPGKSIDELATISDVYQLNHPGKYTIQVSRKEPWSPTIYSNTITISVMAAEPEAEAPK